MSYLHTHNNQPFFPIPLTITLEKNGPKTTTTTLKILQKNYENHNENKNYDDI